MPCRLVVGLLALKSVTCIQRQLRAGTKMGTEPGRKCEKEARLRQREAMPPGRAPARPAQTRGPCPGVAIRCCRTPPPPALLRAATVTISHASEYTGTQRHRRQATYYLAIYRPLQHWSSPQSAAHLAHNLAVSPHMQGRPVLPPRRETTALLLDRRVLDALQASLNQSSL